MATTTSSSNPSRRRRSNRGDGKGNPAVAAVAEQLGIDPAATPEEAALDAAAAAGGEGDMMDLDAELPEVAPEEKPPKVEAAPAPKEPAPQDPAQLSKQTREKLERTPAPPPRTDRKTAAEEKKLARAQARLQSPSTKRLGALGSKVPGAEHIKVEKRTENGTLGYIGSYRAADVAQSQDMQDFIAQYVKPQYGPGEYQLTGVDSQGREIDAGIVTILGPQRPVRTEPLPAPSGGGIGDVSGIMRDLISNAMRPQQQADPIEQIQRLRELQKDFDGGENGAGPFGKKEEGTLAAMIQAMGQQSQSSMNMMITLLTTLLPLMMKKEPDPLMAALVAKLVEDKGGSNMPLPPPAPPPNPMAEMLPVIQAMGEIMRPQHESSTDSLLQQLILKQSEEKLSPKDMLELFGQLRGERGTDDFKKSMENIGFLMNAVQSMQHMTQPGGSSFGEAVTAALSNRELGGALADMIRAKRNQMGAGRPSARALPGQGRTEEELEQQAEALRQRRMQLAQDRLAAEQRLLEDEYAQDPNQHKPRIRPVQPYQQPRVTPPPAEAQGQQHQVPPDEAAEAIERTKARTGGKVPEFPSEIGDHVNAMVAAPEDAQVVEAVIGMLQYLSELEDWEKFATTVFGFIEQGDRVRALHFLHSFFNTLRSLNFMDEPTLDRVMRALNENFDAIVAFMGEVAEEDEEAPGVDLTGELPPGFDPEEELEDEDDEEA